MSSEYTDIHRGFLQIVMSRGTISENSANEVLADLFASGKHKFNDFKMFIFDVTFSCREQEHSNWRGSANRY